MSIRMVRFVDSPWYRMSNQIDISSIHFPQHVDPGQAAATAGMQSSSRPITRAHMATPRLSE